MLPENGSKNLSFNQVSKLQLDHQKKYLPQVIFHILFPIQLSSHWPVRTLPLA